MIAVLGAGAIGCFVGGTWALAGRDVTLIGRPGVLDPIAEAGLRLSGGPEGRTDMLTSLTPEPLSKADLVVVAVKATALPGAIADLRAHLTPGTPIVTLMNGISPPSLIAAALPGVTVLPGMVPFNVVRRGPNHWHKASAGEVIVRDHPATRGLPAVRQVSDMAPVAWGKLLLNLNNAVNALSGLGLHAQLSDRACRGILADAITEALGVLHAAGITPAKVGALPAHRIPQMLRTPDWFFNTVGLRLQGIDRSARSSMADDLAAGRPTEVDFLNGEIVSLAATYGLPAPLNAALTSLVHEVEQTPRAIPAAEIRARADRQG
ncbi:2-dehydropantoate 2-reductase [Rubricella aquisinus]|uniref:2-dehydropantoate 2-reductase n=1 Tax=Rubricella aquisinus TaxID=2028108 RepID=A0A840WYN6_9RHOB|nr:2-dehydropantoate 2-reductase [Rubricella aquisinus]MBB5514776.1 2-dehydropantoate 2-reductase [Rubricella aquisinus]